MTSSRDIEREAEESRAQLSNTLEQLRERLTPGQLLDEVMSGSSAGASAFMKNLGTTMRDNPVPSVLIGAGLLMMVTGTPSLSRGSSSGRSDRYDDEDWSEPGFRSYQDDGRERRLWTEDGTQPMGSGRYRGDSESGLLDKAGQAISDAASSARSMASSAASSLGAAASTVTGAVGGARQRASETLDNTWESTGEAYDSATSAIGDTADEVSRQAGEWTDRARHIASDMSDQVSGAFRTATDRTMQMNRQMRGSVTQMMDEQPLLVGVIGLAIGAGLAALLPTTRVENRLLGDSADRLKDTATGFASEQFQHARNVAGEVMDEVRREAEQQGFSVDKAKEKAKDLAEEIGNRAQAVASKAQDAVSERLPDLDAGKGDAGKGEAGPRSPSDPMHRKDDAGAGRPAGQTGQAGQGAKPGQTASPGLGSGSSASSSTGGVKGPSPAAAQPSVVSTPPTGPSVGGSSTRSV